MTLADADERPVTRRDVRVLVVEDEPLAAEAHAAYVGRVDGLRGRPASRARPRDAGALPRQRPAVDLVLLDMHLPDGHGLELLQRLRAAGHLLRRDRGDLGARRRRRPARRWPRASCSTCSSRSPSPRSATSSSSTPPTGAGWRRAPTRSSQDDVDQLLGALRAASGPRRCPRA